MKIFTSNSLLLLLQNLKTKLDSKSDTNHTHSISNITNLQNTLDSKAASSHTHSAYVNQNAFSNVIVGSTTVAADSATDTLTLVAGSNVTLTPDATNDKITISATDTKYSAATTSAAGLMSKDDKTKLDGITASADSVSFSRSLTSGTKVGTITINGTGTDLYAPTNTDTHYTTGLKVGASNTATANAAATNGNVYLNALDNTTVRDSHKIVGTGATTVTSDANGVITINSTDNNTTYSVATTSVNGLMSSTDKTKLDGIATGANNYTHPASSGNKHIPSGGSSGQILRWSADGTAAWGADNNTTYSVATTSANGLMSSTDKTKLDGIATGANKYSLPTATSSVLGGVKIGSNITNSNGTISLTKANVTSALGYTPPTTNTTYGVATSTTNGLMSAADKKLFDYTNNQLETDLDNLLDKPAESIADIIYPVGSIYMSVNSVNPGALFGGTWEQIAQGRTLFGAGRLNGIKYTAGEEIDAGLPDPQLNLLRRQDSTSSGVYKDIYGTNGYTAAAPSNTGGTDEWMQSMKAMTAANRYMDVVVENPIYGNSTTVQPNALVVYIWKRTA